MVVGGFLERKTTRCGLKGVFFGEVHYGGPGFEVLAEEEGIGFVVEVWIGSWIRGVGV